MVHIIGVTDGSLADRAGIRADDILISINGNEIFDVLDYRFYLADTLLQLTVHRGPELLDFSIRKRMYDDIGLDFETPLMDKKHSCENKCIFCFIDQLPSGMRSSLYFKDDDSRLSFLHGNYITMTNLKQHDIDRIIKMHISPVNISIHTTNPELRVRMMHNKRAGEVLDYIRQLAEAGIKLRGQIVLCRGVNDGDELTRTIHDLCAFYPALDSVSIVPAGLTGHRCGLYPLEPFSPEECGRVIRQVDAYGEECLRRFGERVFYCSDEFYIKSGMKYPSYEYWGDFSQIENGVGMLASFEYELDLTLSMLSDDELQVKRTVTIATGAAAYDFIVKMVEKITAVCYNVACRIVCVQNDYFGGEVTVAGLLTGIDICRALKDESLGDELLLPITTLRAEHDLFLCGMTPEEMTDILGVPIRFTDNDGGAFLDAVLGSGGLTFGDCDA